MKSTNTDKNTSRQVAKILFESGCVIFRTRTPFRFTSGLLSPIYVDNRRLISLPKERKKIARFLAKKILENGIPEIIAGTATAGIPHAAWVAEELELPMVYVRSQAKKHGRKNQVEGIAKRGLTAVVIEDLISTGKSSIEAVLALTKLGVNVKYVLAIYSHNLKEAEDNFKKSRIKLMFLANLNQVIDFAKEKGFLRPDDQIPIILDWAKDPKNWGKKMGFE